MKKNITEDLFDGKYYIIDHYEVYKNYKKDDVGGFEVIEEAYIEEYEIALSQNKIPVLYCATDSWVWEFEPLLEKMPKAIPITNCLGNVPSKFKWLPHWLISTDTDPAPIVKTKVPSIRWSLWVRRPRPWRIELLKEIAAQQCTSGEIVFPKHLIEPKGNRTWSTTKELFQDDVLYNYIEPYIKSPIGISAGENGAYKPMWEIRQNRAIDVITETSPYSKNGEVFFSEKTFKALRAGQLFLLFGQPNSIKELKKLGFITFDNIINHDYDSIEDISVRTKLIVKELKRLSDIDKDKWNKIWEGTYTARMYNQSHLKKHWTI